jgi:hypothetical protein
MKKIVLTFVLAAILATGSVFAAHPNGLGIGVQGGYGIGFTGYNGSAGAALSLKIPNIPIFWAVNLNFGDNFFGIGLTGDKYIFDQKISGPFGWYLGLGLYFNYYSWSFSNTDYSPVGGLGVGARVPIGLSIQPVKFFEIFLDVAPALGLYVNFEGKYKGVIYRDGGMGLAFGMPLEIGLRFWL